MLGTGVLLQQLEVIQRPMRGWRKAKLHVIEFNSLLWESFLALFSAPAAALNPKHCPARSPHLPLAPSPTTHSSRDRTLHYLQPPLAILRSLPDRNKLAPVTARS
jgi:hypothetical protein